MTADDAMQLCQNWSEPPTSRRRDGCCEQSGIYLQASAATAGLRDAHPATDLSSSTRDVYGKEERIPLNKSHPTRFG